MRSRVSTLALTAALALGACASKPTPAGELEAPAAEPEDDASLEPADAQAPEPDPEPAHQADAEPTDDSATREALAATIRGYLPDLQACYEAELPRDASLAGKMTYTITVAPGGSISAVVVELDTVEDERVHTCAVQMIEGWTFVAADVEDASEITFSVRFAAV